MISCSLYIHIPFCASFCDYCDFYSVNVNDTNDDYINSFLTSLVFDIKSQIEYFNVDKIKSCYIGGGTPSVLGKKIRFLLDALNKTPQFTPLEFSVEANPESITEDLLSICRGAGINRFSLGVQTFHEKSRIAVNRALYGEVLEDRLALASRYFPGMLSADLITGLPYQNELIVKDDIKRLLSFEPVHISLYSLSVEDGAPLKEKIKNKTVTIQDGDFSDSLWLEGRDELINEGFIHYEVSNFSLPGKECLHNIHYWQMKNWLGAGPSASGTIIDDNSGGAKRYTYLNDVDEYIKILREDQKKADKKPSFRAVNSEELDRDTLLKECILMGFRYLKGPDPNLFKKRFGSAVEECIGKTLEKWKDKDKMLFLNSFLYDAFTELDNGIY
ncbi:MAG: coproporphyrinogen III oxidase family protein [Treponema sp.]|nr:coproporphyrinogen III oxidase family protein [Treponema sp.]